MELAQKRILPAYGLTDKPGPGSEARVMFTRVCAHQPEGFAGQALRQFGHKTISRYERTPRV
jgi:hypothetical protein